MSAPSGHRYAQRRAGRWRVLLGSLVLALAAAPIMLTTTAGAAPPPGTPVLHQTAELVSIPLGTDSLQGMEVALSADGTTLVVGTAIYTSPWAVLVYVRSGGRWLTQTTLRGPVDPDGWYNGGPRAVAISADGDTLAVGDPYRIVTVGDTDLLYAGGVSIFTRSGQTWRAASRFVAPRPSQGTGFGRDVSISGDGSRVLVGSLGHAYVADVHAGDWVVQELPGTAGIESFASSSAISPDGKTVVVGAEGSGGSWPLFPGAAFVWVDDPGRGWVQRWHLEGQLVQGGSRFGAAVAVTDTGTVVVGAPKYPHTVSVFDRRGATLVRTARFTPRYNSQALGLGTSVAISSDGSTVVAGAPNRRLPGGIVNAGAGYRWVRSPGGWSWAGLLSVAHPHSDEYQGYSTAVSGDGRVVALGAPRRTSARLGTTGAVIVFSAVP